MKVYDGEKRTQPSARRKLLLELLELGLKAKLEHSTAKWKVKLSPGQKMCEEP